MRSQQTLQNAHQEYVSGNLLNAKNILTNIIEYNSQDAPSLHLLAIIEKKLGGYDNSLSLFDKALRMSPNDAEIFSNKANLLADMQDRDSIKVYGEAIRLQPTRWDYRLNRAITYLNFGDPQSALLDVKYLAPHMQNDPKFWTVAGQAYLAANQKEQAKLAFKRALDLEPKRMTALAGFGGILLKEGDISASDYLRQALQLRPTAKELALSYAESLEAEGKAEAAVSFLTDFIRNDLSWVAGHNVLARMRWEDGDSAFVDLLENAIASQKDNVDLRIALIETFSMSHMFDKALENARHLTNDFEGRQDYQLVEAKLSRLCGHFDEAIALHETMSDTVPGKAFEAAQLWIRLTDFEKAQFLLDRARLENEDVEFWAIQGVLWRLTNAAKSQWLHRDDLIQICKLDLSAEALEAIAETLRGFHNARQHPIGQSLRQGTQTRGCLFDRSHEHVAILHSAIEKAVDEYWRALPDYDAAHPLLRHRNTQLEFSGSWSVRLREEGFHIPHIHPRGVLSSACYIVLPPAQPDSAGWLELGCPSPDLGLDIGPIKTVEPMVGHLALFPSTLYHGTIPFAQGERLTVAFDLVAAKNG